MKASEIKFRCSQLYRLMTESRSKSELISETAKKYCIEAYITAKYGRKKDITSKHILKGLMVEEDAITSYSLFKNDLFFKNEINLKNDYITGTPDLFTGEQITNADKIIDIKSSWDLWSFYDNKTSDKINPAYEWQLLGYMWLTGAKEAELAYCLVDTPEQLIVDEKRKFMWKAGYIDDEASDCRDVLEEIEKGCLFSDIPANEKVFIIHVDYDADKIERLKERIEIARMWIDHNLISREV